MTKGRKKKELITFNMKNFKIVFEFNSLLRHSTSTVKMLKWINDTRTNLFETTKKGIFNIRNEWGKYRNSGAFLSFGK